LFCGPPKELRVAVKLAVQYEVVWQEALARM
jgi:hypothetical protein